MKKIILSVLLAGFALAVQAGDEKTAATQEKPACCAKAKATASADKAECPMAKEAKASCPMMNAQKAHKDTVVKQALLSPKDAARK